MILVYAFSNQWGTNISHRTLLDLQKLIPPSPYISFQLIRFHPRDFFKKYINNNQYDLIIGLGDSYGPSSRIRIETRAKNAYADQPIHPFSPIFLDLNLANIDNYDSSIFKISSNMGTYNCNWIAYQTQLNINNKHPTTFHLFFHLPKRVNSSILSSHIFNLLADNQLITENVE